VSLSQLFRHLWVIAAWAIGTVGAQGFTDLGTLAVTAGGAAPVEVKLNGRISTEAPTLSSTVAVQSASFAVQLIEGGPLCSIKTVAPRESSTKPPLGIDGQLLIGPVFDIALVNCNGSSEVAMTLKVPGDLRNTARAATLNRGGGAPAWRVIDTVPVDSRTLRFTAFDGGQNDLDANADGMLSVTVGVTVSSQLAAPAPIPTLSPLALALLGIMFVGVGLYAAKRLDIGQKALGLWLMLGVALVVGVLGGDSIREVQAQATGNGLVVRPTHLYFQTPSRDTESPTQTVRVTNGGTTSVPSISIQVQGNFTERSTCSGSLAPGAHCTVTVTYLATKVPVLASIDRSDFTVNVQSQSFVLRGSNLARVDQVLFGPHTVNVTSKSDTTIEVSGVGTSIFNAVGTFEVRARISTTGLTSNALSVNVHPPAPVLASIDKSDFGVNFEFQNFVLRGSNLARVDQVLFGPHTLNVTSTSDTTIAVSGAGTPVFNALGTFEVRARVSTTGQTSNALMVNVRPVDDVPTLFETLPPNTPANGQAVNVLVVSQLPVGSLLLVDEKSVEYTRDRLGAIFTLPASMTATPRSIPVRIVSPAGASTLTLQLRVTDPSQAPLITGFSPAQLVQVRPTGLSVLGERLSNVTGIRLGFFSAAISNATANAVTMNSVPNILTQPLGKIPVRVIDKDGIYSNTLELEIIVDPITPVVTSVTPSRGRVGDVVTIRGSNFLAPDLAVAFGGRQTVPHVVTENELRVRVPQVPIGSSSLAIMVNGQIFVSRTFTVDGNEVFPPSVREQLAKLPDRGAQAPIDRFRFLYESEPRIQTGVQPGAIAEESASALRGRVFLLDENPLGGVTVSILNRPDLGQTRTRADGSYDMAVEGGKELVVVFTSPTFLPVHRRVTPFVGDISVLQDVIMTSLNSRPGRVMGNASGGQVYMSTEWGDTEGFRTTNLYFQPGTTFTLEGRNGQNQTVPSINVRATEYTATSVGPLAMPGALPANSGYTFAVELSADEVELTNSRRVSFNRPVYVYVNNFIKMGVGSAVPSGYFDLEKSTWIGSANGRVIRVLSRSAGSVVLDVEGKGVAASAAELQALGITAEEIRTMSSALAPGEYWRVPVEHFTPWDFNWPYAVPAGATAPPRMDEFPLRLINGDPEPEAEWCDSCGGGRFNAQRLTSTEKVSISGTPFSLTYHSGYTVDYLEAGNQVIRIPTTLARVPQDVVAVIIEVTIQGDVTRFRLARSELSPNQVFEIRLPKLDAYGRAIVGRVPVRAEVTYVYPAVYYQIPADFANAWGQIPGGRTLTTVPGRVLNELPPGDLAIALRRDHSDAIPNKRGTRPPHEALGMSIGGWTLDVHHGHVGGELIGGDGVDRLDRSYLIADLRPSLSSEESGFRAFVSADGARMHEFRPDGRHVRTVDVATGLTHYRMTYDTLGRIIAIDDQFNRTTRIERDGRGVPIAIVAPGGQRTVIGVNANGMLSSLTDPANGVYTMTYLERQLLQFLRRPGTGNITQYEYDGQSKFLYLDRPKIETAIITRRPIADGYQVDIRDGMSRKTSFSATSSIGTLRETYIQKYVSPAGITEELHHDNRTVTQTKSNRSETDKRTLFEAYTAGLQQKFAAESLRTIGERPVRYRNLPLQWPNRGLPQLGAKNPVQARSEMVQPFAISLAQLEFQPATARWVLRQSNVPVATTIVDARGLPTQLQEDSRAPLNYEFDAQGRVVRTSQSVSSDLRQSSFEYSPEGWLSRAIDPLGRRTQFQYDGLGRLKEREQAGAKTVLAYAASGLIERVSPPGQPSHEFRYDSESAHLFTAYLAPQTGAGPLTTSYSYNRLGLLAKLTRPSQQVVTWAYTASGRLASVAAGAMGYGYQWSDQDLLSRASSPDGVTTTFTYDDGLPIRLVQSGAAGGLDFKREHGWRLSEIKADQGRSIPYTYRGALLAKAGEVEYSYLNASQGETTRIHGVKLRDLETAYAYDGFGQLQSQTTKTVGQGTAQKIVTRNTYTYDKAHRLVRRNEQRRIDNDLFDVEWSYEYDALDRLAVTRLNDVVMAKYSYDANGNRQLLDVGAGNRTMVTDVARLTPVAH
jgi:YD repeat-containing protein